MGREALLDASRRGKCRSSSGKGGRGRTGGGSEDQEGANIIQGMFFFPHSGNKVCTAAAYVLKTVREQLAW